MKTVRKVTSLILSVAMLLAVCSVNICTAETDVTVTEMLFEDFEDGTFNFTPSSEGDATVTYEKFSDSPQYKNAVKFDITGSATLAGKEYLMNATDAFARNNEGADLYTEVSFDIAPSISNIRPMYVYMRNKDARKTLFTLKWQNQKFIISKNGSESEVCDYQDGQMMNVRVVAQLTDSEGATVDRITGVYINDVLVGANLYPIGFENVGTGKFDQLDMLIRNTAVGQNLSASLDNVRIVKYKSPDGVSPMASNKVALCKAIDTLYDFIKSNDDYIPEDEKEPLNDVLTDGTEMYKSSYATTSEVAEMVAEINETIDNCPVVLPEYKTVMFENFDDDEITYKKETGAAVLDSLFVDELNNKMYDKSLKFDLSDKVPAKEGEKTGFGYYIGASADIGSAFFRTSETDMMYCETEFDIVSFGTVETARPVYIYLQNSTANKNLAYISLDTGNIRTSTGKIGEYNDGEAMHFKIVYQFNDVEGNACRKVAGIYKDGELLASNIEVETDGADKFDRINIFAAVQYSDKTNVGCYFDNLCITKYSSANGISKSPVRDKAAVSLKKAYDKLTTAELDETEKAKLLQECDSLAGKYRSCYSKEDMLEVYTGAEYILNKLSFADTSDDIKLYTPVVTGDVYGSSVYVSADILSKSTRSNVYTAVLLMKKSEASVNGENVQAVINKLTLEADRKTSASAEFDLSGISKAERDKLFIKVLAFTIDSENKVSLIGSYDAVGGEAVFAEEAYTFSDGVNIYQVVENDGGSDVGHFVVTVNGNKEPDTLLIILKKDISLENFVKLTDSSEIKNSIEYITTEKTNKNGKTVFEKIPSGGTGSYTVIVSNDTVKNTTVKNFYDIGYITDMIAELYGTKTINTVDKYKDCLGIDTAVYRSATANELDIEKEIKILLSEKVYTEYDINQFGKALLNRLEAVNSFYEAKNVDSVELALSEYSEYITNYVKLKSLRNTATYIYNNRKSVKSIESLNTIFDDGNKDSGSGGTGGSTGGSSGSSGNGGKTNVTFGTAAVIPPEMSENTAPSVMQGYLNAYDDLDGYDWVEEAIINLSAKGYISGKGENKFAPGDNITREEFVKIAVLVFEIYNEGAETSFSDVKSSDWFYKYVASACEKEILNGVEEGVFGTGMNLTREDLAVIIYRLMQETNVSFTEDGEYIPFVDEEAFADYAKDAIVELAKSGVVNGIGNNEFAPKNLCTRAEATKMLYIAYKLREGVK